MLDPEVRIYARIVDIGVRVVESSVHMQAIGVFVIDVQFRADTIVDQRIVFEVYRFVVIPRGNAEGRVPRSAVIAYANRRNAGIVVSGDILECALDTIAGESGTDFPAVIRREDQRPAEALEVVTIGCGLELRLQAVAEFAACITPDDGVIGTAATEGATIRPCSVARAKE